MRTLSQVLVAVAVILEVLAITAIVQTSSAMSKGGDVITLTSDGTPIDIDGKTETFPKGTYVMTPAGLVPLPWHWVLKYAYGTVAFPFALAVVGIYLWRRTGKAPQV